MILVSDFYPPFVEQKEAPLFFWRFYWIWLLLLFALEFFLTQAS